jgi:hypothetical protein
VLGIFTLSRRTSSAFERGILDDANQEPQKSKTLNEITFTPTTRGFSLIVMTYCAAVWPSTARTLPSPAQVRAPTKQRAPITSNSPSAPSGLFCAQLVRANPVSPQFETTGRKDKTSSLGLPMPPQKTVFMGKKAKAGASSRGRGGGRGRSQTAGASRQGNDSATPAAQAARPPIKLKLNMSLDGGQKSKAYPTVIDFGQANEAQAEEEEDEELPLRDPGENTRRSGRDFKQPRYDDYIYSSEMEGQLTTPVGKASDKEYMISPRK